MHSIGGMMLKSVKYLFFIEREFHLVLLLPIMQYIKKQGFGEMAIYHLDQNKARQVSPIMGLGKIY